MIFWIGVAIAVIAIVSVYAMFTVSGNISRIEESREWKELWNVYPMRKRKEEK